MTRTALNLDAEGYLFHMGTVLGWSKEELIVYLAGFRKELAANKHRAYWPQKVIWGRKPE